MVVQDVREAVNSTLWHAMLYEDQLRLIATIFETEIANFEYCPGNVFGNLLEALDGMAHVQPANRTPYTIFRNRIQARNNHEYRGTIPDRDNMRAKYVSRYKRCADTISGYNEIKKAVQGMVDKYVHTRSKREVNEQYICELAVNCFKYQIAYFKLLATSCSCNSLVMDAVIRRVNES